MKPVVDGLMDRYPDTIIQLDAGGSDPQAAELASRYGVQYVPTFVFVRSDGTVFNTVVGAVPESRLVQELEMLQ